MSARDRQREEWLRQVLGARARRVRPASEDASFRRYFRVDLDGDTRIVMDAPPPHEDCRPFVQVSALLAAAGVNVPRVFAADVEEGFLLLSDLGSRPYLDALDAHSADALYGDALDALVRMQRHADASALPHYDRDRLLAEMRLFPDWFLRRHLGIEPDGTLAGTLTEAFDFLVEECLAQPQVFVHRDYHSRNLMVTGRDNPGVLDYQDAVRGPVTYDLVSLLRDVYVRWPQERVAAWVARWHALADGAGLLDGVGLARCERWFDLTGVQRHLKVAGIFARLYYRDGKSRYLADVPLTLDYLLDVARRHDELSALVAALDALDVRARNGAATAAVTAAVSG